MRLDSVHGAYTRSVTSANCAAEMAVGDIVFKFSCTAAAAAGKNTLKDEHVTSDRPEAANWIIYLATVAAWIYTPYLLHEL